DMRGLLRNHRSCGYFGYLISLLRRASLISGERKRFPSSRSIAGVTREDLAIRLPLHRTEFQPQGWVLGWTWFAARSIVAQACCDFILPERVSFGGHQRCCKRPVRGARGQYGTDFFRLHHTLGSAWCESLQASFSTVCRPRSLVVPPRTFLVVSLIQYESRVTDRWTCLVETCTELLFTEV